MKWLESAEGSGNWREEGAPSRSIPKELERRLNQIPLLLVVTTVEGRRRGTALAMGVASPMGRKTQRPGSGSPSGYLKPMVRGGGSANSRNRRREGEKKCTCAVNGWIKKNLLRTRKFTYGSIKGWKN